MAKYDKGGDGGDRPAHETAFTGIGNRSADSLVQSCQAAASSDGTRTAKSGAEMMPARILRRILRQWVGELLPLDALHATKVTETFERQRLATTARIVGSKSP